MSEPLLSVDSLTSGYDAVNILHDVSLSAFDQQITCLLGANGAGKTTLIRSIFGSVRARHGRIRFRGEDITRLDTHQIVQRGLIAVPEGNRVFPKLSVLENLHVGAYLETSKTRIADRLERVFELFPRLRERMSQYAGTLSGGERSMLSIGRSLMSAPRMLIIDEPSLGLSPRFVKENFRIVKETCAAACPVLLVEQNAHQTLEISHRGYVMAQGSIVYEGLAQQLRSSREVADAYFAQ
jgi:branched-chain amino acid transport system ATP-binding protein